MLREQVAPNRARLGRASEVPKGSDQGRLCGEPPALAFQDAQADVPGSGEVSQMKSRPRFVGQGMVDVKRTQSLRLLLVRGGFAKVARVTVEHPRHVIGRVAARAESERFLA